MLAPRFMPPSPRNPAMTPTPVVFSPRSEALLSGADPKLAELMRLVEAQHPNAFEITEGLRDRERQAKLLAEGKSQTMNSKHLTGNAVDIVLMGPDGKPNWDFEAYRPIADTAKATAAAMGIPDFVWGGDWKTLKDGVHFQVGGPGVAQNAGAAPPVMAPTGGAATVEQPPSIMPVNPQTDEKPKSMWERLAEISADMIPQQEQQSAQLMPMQRTPYVAPERNDLAPYLQFLATLR